MHLAKTLFAAIASVVLLIPATSRADHNLPAPTKAMIGVSSATTGSGLKPIPVKASAMKQALEKNKVVVVRQESTGRAYQVMKVTDNHVVVHPGPAQMGGSNQRLTMSEFKQRFDQAAKSKDARGSFN
jgi:hypothetical protein